MDEAVGAGLDRDAAGARAWRRALEPLSGEQRQVFIETLRAYEREVSGG